MDDLLSDPLGSKRQKLLQQMTVAQLRQLAKVHRIELRNTGFLSGNEPLKSKEDIVQRLWEASEELPTKAIEQSLAAVPVESLSVNLDKTEIPVSATTPTLASTRTVPLVSMDEVVAYLDQYRFISRYSEEAFYEVELAGALRERFGTVVRQNPVAVPGKRLAIDLDVGGIGIEIKANITADKPLRDAIGQLADYRQFYGEKLVFLLIGTHGFDVRKNEIRQTGVIFIEK